MKIGSVRHRGLRRLIESGDPSGLPADMVDKVRKILSFLDAMGGEEELGAVPLWKAHRLSGGRRGVWSLHVSKNWRLTFRIGAGAQIDDLDYEDYH